MFLRNKKLFSHKSASLLVASIINLSLLFFPVIYSADKSEGEVLALQALKQIQDGLIDNSPFIIKDPPCMRARVSGESKAIGIYISSSTLRVNDRQEDRRLLEHITDMIVRGLMQMLRSMEQGEKQIFISESVDIFSQPVYMLLSRS